MRTAMHKRNLLLATLVWVAPLSAEQHSGAVKHHSSACPYERAREAAAAAAAARVWQPPKAATTITLTDRVPADSSLFSLGRESGFLNP